MAERRMFAKSVIDSDEFLEMPVGAQLLYFHLSMRADDDGFITPRKVMRLIGARDDDMKILMVKKFIIPFESGVVVIRHWKVNNYLRNDRYKETVYQDEKSMLDVNNNVYVEHMYDSGIPDGIPSGNPGKDRIDKDRIGYSNILSENLSENQVSDVKLILDYLNIKSKKNFRATTKSYQRSINARLSEGYTIEDFKHVIDVKCAEWMGTEHEQYLRPDTLFAPSHFDSYLNQSEFTPEKRKSKCRGLDFRNELCREEIKNEESIGF